MKTSKTGIQRPATRYDGIGKIGGGYGFLVSMVSKVVSRCPWLPSWGPWLPKFVLCYPEVVPGYPDSIPGYLVRVPDYLGLSPVI